MIRSAAICFAESTPRRPTAPSPTTDRKSTRLNSSHSQISYAVFCLKKKKTIKARLITALTITDVTSLTVTPPIRTISHHEPSTGIHEYLPRTSSNHYQHATHHLVVL